MCKQGFTPKLRFEGFSDTWEQRKLGELVKFSKGSGYSKGDLKESGTPIILYGRLYTKYETVIANVDTFADAKAGSVYSHGGEVIVPASGETAEDISIASVVEKSGVLLGGDLNIITPPGDLDSAFLAISVSNGKPHNDMAKMAQGKSVVHLHNTDLEKIDLTYPSNKEQQKISGLFRDIDTIITLHQRKFNMLEKARLFYLRRLFPEKGQKSPDLRIAKYTGEWERKRLGDVVVRYEDPVPTPHGGYERLGIRSHAKGTFHSYVEEGKGLETAQMHRVAANKFIVNITFGWEHAVAITTEEDAGKLVSHRFPQFRFIEGMLPDFFKYVILDKRFKHHLGLSSPGGAGRNRVLNLNDMLKYEMFVPNTEEQRDIAAFMSSFDNIIDLQNRRLNALKALKQFMLQNLFPEEV